MKSWNAAADEQRFRDDVQTGDAWVQRVARTCRLIGLWDVYVPLVEVRGDYEDRRDFRDQGDLFLNGHRIEVRSLGHRFTTPGDYPQRTVLVELATVMPHKANAVAYLFVSRPTGTILALVKPDLRRLERVNDIWDSRRGCARDWLVASRAKLKPWDDAVTYLADRCAIPIEVGT